jgi:hypothetical protein
MLLRPKQFLRNHFQDNKPINPKHINLFIYKTLLRPISTYGSERWPIYREEENTLQIF